MPLTGFPAIEMDALLEEAMSRQRNGEFAEAERLYTEILAVHPRHGEANHRMGMLAMHAARIPAALRHFQFALSSDPRHPRYWVSCIEGLIAAGQHETAREVFAHARKCGLEGAAAETLAARLNPPASEIAESSGTAPEEKPNSRSATKTSNLRGPSKRETDTICLLLDRGLLAKAEARARSLTTRFPERSLAWEVLGVVLNRAGKTDAAIEAAEHSVGLSPANAEVRYNLANLERVNGRLKGAEASYRAALALKPDYADAWLNLGITLKSQGRAESAVFCYRRAIEVNPEYAAAHSNLAILLWHLGKLNEAEASYRRALEIDPDFAELHSNLASLLVRCGRLAEAEASCRRALELKPGLSEAWNNLGDTLQTAGRDREAAHAYRRAIHLKPDYPEAHSNLLFCLSHDESITPAELFTAHIEFGRTFEGPLRDRWPRHSNSRDPGRKLTIGFVSGDFREHAMAYFIEPLFASLAKNSELSLRAYSNSLTEDAVTLRLRAFFEQWRRVADIPDCTLAAQIEADAIDILIDLSGHTSGNRLLTFAQKPAPLQASWIGYPGTTGLTAMDYYFADRFFLPLDEFASQFTERIVHLPAVSPFLPFQDAPPVNRLPALENGYLTLGSFNRPAKLSPAVIGLWSRLLRALPDAQMLIGGLPPGDKCDALLGWFAAESIAPERLRLLPRSSVRDYLEMHHQVDFCLDTFPYGGCTTTSHALWMGVPTLSIAGPTPAGREGTTFLHHLGLEDFIARDPDDFGRKGLALAAKPGELSKLRLGLRKRLGDSALGHPELIADGLSQALRTMWRRWCAGLPPEAF